MTTSRPASNNDAADLIIFGYIREGLRLPVVNVIVLVVLLLTVIPVGHLGAPDARHRADPAAVGSRH